MPSSFKTAIINMPFSPAEGGSIQMGILKALTDEACIPTDVFYFNIDFFIKLKQAGLHSFYNSQLPALVGEWLFSPLNSPLKGDAIIRIKNFAQGQGLSIEDMMKVKEEIIPSFIDQLRDSIPWDEYSVAGFSLSFPQINASMRLAEKIKQKNPFIKTVLGGALSQIHQDSVQEMLNIFPQSDYFVVGDAEPVFIPLLKAIEENRTPPQLPGVFYKGYSPQSLSVLEDIDQSPIPQYLPYFQKYQKLPYNLKFLFNRHIPLETARGCPWGEKNPCKFCAFYPGEKYRRKSKERIIKEVDTQIAQYSSRSFYVVDSAVMPSVIEDVFPHLEEKKCHIPFIEVRTNMKRKHAQLLKRGGVNLIQPGIEALGETLLKKMNKGVSLFNNILFLKWCRELGIRVSYNLILGLPDTQKEDLEEQLNIIKKIFHLDPPFPMDLALVRFSHYQTHPHDYLIQEMKADPFYKYIYPHNANTEKLAYNFIAHYPLDMESFSLLGETLKIISKWQSLWGTSPPPFLTLHHYQDKMAFTSETKNQNSLTTDENQRVYVVKDGRTTPRKPAIIPLSPVEYEIIKTLSPKERSLAGIIEDLPLTDKEEIVASLQFLQNKNLIIESKSKYLSLITE